MRCWLGLVIDTMVSKMTTREKVVWLLLYTAFLLLGAGVAWLAVEVLQHRSH